MIFRAASEAFRGATRNGRMQSLPAGRIGCDRQSHRQAAAALAHQLEFICLSHKIHWFNSQAFQKRLHTNRRLTEQKACHSLDLFRWWTEPVRFAAYLIARHSRIDQMIYRLLNRNADRLLNLP